RLRGRAMTLGELVARHQIVISAGSGGVGKTTVAASLALWGALEGRRAVVLTIDPARRLASSLGLASLGSEERDIPAEHFRAQGLAPKGTLAAMMLDQKGAWDALVERHAPPEARDRILTNRFYQHLSQSFAGSYEYMAIEQLCALAESGRYDLIVVDTPPTRHALDFLEAPRRIADFLDRKIIKWFVRPYFSAGWSALRAVNRMAGFLLRRLAAGAAGTRSVRRTWSRLRTRLPASSAPRRPGSWPPTSSTTRCWRAASRCASSSSVPAWPAACRSCTSRTSRATCTTSRAWPA